VTDYGTNMSYKFYFESFPTGTNILYYVTKCKGKSFMTPGNAVLILLNSFVKVVTVSAINERQHQ
jgi:hypothetical protein